MAAEIDAEPLPRRRLVPAGARARASCSRPPTSSAARINPVALAGNGVVRAGAAPALREFVRATGIPVAETFMGKGLIAAGRPEGARLGRPPGGRLPHGRLRRGRRGAGDRLRPRRALARALEPEARQEDRLHRLGAGRDRRVLHARGRAGRRPLPHAHPAGRGVPPRAAPGRLDAAARRGARPLRGGARTTTPSRCSRRARSGRSARRSAARTS